MLKEKFRHSRESGNPVKLIVCEADTLLIILNLSLVASGWNLDYGI